MTQTPTHQPPSADGGASRQDRHDVGHEVGLEVEHPATRAAQARQTNAHRATHAAQALHRHGHVSHSDADDIQQALVELLTDLHHLCDTCDLDLTPLYQAATLIHTRETQAA